jgi:uncharacterized protein (DUF58 family)
VRPGKRLFVLLWLWLALGVAGSIWPNAALAWWVAGAGMALLAMVDAGMLIVASPPVAARRVSGTLPVGVWSEVVVRIENPTRHTIRAEVFDHHPVMADVRGLPQRVRVPRAGWVQVSYQIRPTERGAHRFEQVQMLIDSRLGLWRRNRLLGDPQTVRIYPNFAEVAKYTLFATDHRLSQMGIKKRRRRGEGLEFHQLREYRVGDPLRQIDWKATSRHKRLISREYQEERDQQIVFLIDCGRRMLAKDSQLSHFDHALNAMLLLSYVALRQGDAVSFMSFAGPERFLPPQKGAASINVVLNAVYDLQPTLHSPDYPRAATDLLTRLRKRSLVVILTNLRDEDADELMPAIALLRRQHLVLLASLQEEIINQAASAPVHDFADALHLAATDLFLEERRRAHEEIKRFGAQTLDVEPVQLPVALVNRYLDIKSSGRL